LFAAINTRGEVLDMQLPETWRELSDEEKVRFTDKLRNEVCETHLLAKASVSAMARRKTDDFLFCGTSSEARCFVVHLTWHKETSPDFPWTAEFLSFEDFSSNWRRHYD